MHTYVIKVEYHLYILAVHFQFLHWNGIAHLQGVIIKLFAFSKCTDPQLYLYFIQSFLLKGEKFALQVTAVTRVWMNDFHIAMFKCFLQFKGHNFIIEPYQYVISKFISCNRDPKLHIIA